MHPRGFRDRFIVFLADGFGIGRIPFAPGTWGSLLGVFYAMGLARSGSLTLYISAIVLGFFVAVAIGGKAEKILHLEDPGRFVIDEIAALPIVYLPVLDRIAILNSRALIWLVAGFLLFRLFDISKPLGIKQSQAIGGGWGLVIDDYLAASLAAIVMGVAARFF